MTRAVFALTLVGGVALWAAPSAAWEITQPICIDDAILDPEVVKDFQIPLGCELIDCCPGCPVDAPLDWRVRVDGNAIASAQLVFDDARPRVEGNARSLERGARLGLGETHLYGLPPSPREGRAPAASLTLTLVPGALAALKERAARARGVAEAEVARVALEQLLGGVVVNDFLLELKLSSCQAQPAGICDEVAQQSNQGNDRSVIQLDGRRPDGSCFDDALFRATGSADAGDVRSQGSCAEEVAVYSKGDAMTLLVDPGFEDACGDAPSANLGPLLEAPLNIWVAGVGAPSFFGGGVDLTALSGIHVAKAIQLYDENKTGISFQATTRPLPGTLGGIASLALACTGIFNVPGVDAILTALKASPAYVQGEFNVYYLDLGIFSFTGANCSADRNVTFISTAASETTLAHEFGHAFAMHGNQSTGGHTNGHMGFTKENLMWVNGGVARSHVSLGQAFRMNVDAASMLNLNSVRSGPQRSCPLLSSSPDCPSLARDWVRP